MTETISVRERPILFSSEMVRALLENRKTMTRRIVKPQPVSTKRSRRMDELIESCPFGNISDRLWVRETFCPRSNGMLVMEQIQRSFFRATDGEGERNTKPHNWRWRPSIHMPRWASRITLEITNVRVERLQEISEEDAHAEGIWPDPGGRFQQARGVGPFTEDPRLAFRWLWDSINGKYPDKAWAASPWVWVVSFKRIEQEKQHDRPRQT